MSVLNYSELKFKLQYLYGMLSSLTITDTLSIIGYVLLLGEYVKYEKSIEDSGKYYCSATVAGKYGDIYRLIIVLRNSIAHGDSYSVICDNIQDVINKIVIYDGQIDNTIYMLTNVIGVNNLRYLYDYFYRLEVPYSD